MEIWQDLDEAEDELQFLTESMENGSDDDLELSQ